MHKVRKFNHENISKMDGTLYYLFKNDIPYVVKALGQGEYLVSFYQ